MRRRRLSALLLACVAVPAAMIAGCGGSGGSSSADVGPAAAVPANAALYIDGTVKPTGQAQTDAKAALGKVLDTADPGGKIVSLLEQQAKSDGHPFNYQQDVAPWLGEKAGFFFTDLAENAQKGAAVIETTQPGGVPRLRTQGLGSDGDQPRARRPTTAPATRPNPTTRRTSSARSATSW